MRWRGGSNDCGGLSLVALPAADLERETGPVDQQAYDDLGVEPPLLGAVTHPPQIILTLGLEIQGGDVVQIQGQAPAAGDVIEQGLRDRLAVAPLHAASQGAEQGPGVDRLQAQITQGTGNLGLGGCRLDQTRQNHLLEGPITLDRLTQPQAGICPVQNVLTAGPSAWTPPPRQCRPGLRPLEAPGPLAVWESAPGSAGPGQCGASRSLSEQPTRPQCGPIPRARSPFVPEPFLNLDLHRRRP